MSKVVSSLMFTWLSKRRQLREAFTRHADRADVERLERETTAAFAAWRDAARSLDEAA
ncbi:MAG: hypothetical protein ACYC3S_11890 [Chloroflexota bacterium]